MSLLRLGVIKQHKTKLDMIQIITPKYLQNASPFHSDIHSIQTGGTLILDCVVNGP